METDGVCAWRPICVAARSTTTLLSGFGWRHNETPSRVEHLSTSHPQVCPSHSASRGVALACKALEGSTGSSVLLSFFGSASACAFLEAAWND